MYMGHPLSHAMAQAMIQSKLLGSEVDLDKLEFGVMRELFEVGDAYIEELEALKAAHKAKSVEAGAKKRRKAEDLLRIKDPW